MACIKGRNVVLNRLLRVPVMILEIAILPSGLVGPLFSLSYIRDGTTSLPLAYHWARRFRT
jgi:hypothetical protein